MQLVINTPGTFLTQKDECFRLKQKEKVFDISPLKVESIVIFNQTMITTQAVKRHQSRFPEDFMFKLSKNEYGYLISQIVTSSDIKYAKQVHAFTEQGVAMLSGILNSDRAIAVNIQIMRTFTKLRHMILDNEDLKRELAELKEQTDERFQIVFETLDQLLTVDVNKKQKLDLLSKQSQRI